MSPSSDSPDARTDRPVQRIGVVGGGQLGRMLAHAAARLGLETVVLDPQPDCPARQFASSTRVGSLQDADAIQALAADCARDGVWEFLLCAPALKIAHGVGTPLNPLAVK